MDENSALPKNVLPLIGLSREYCSTLAHATDFTLQEFVEKMIRFLPRIYIMVTDINPAIMADEPDSYIVNALDEEYYDLVRDRIEKLTGEDDVYLEVFEADMKYSDTPVSASIAEGLADIFQVLFNFLAAVEDATDETVGIAMAGLAEDFRQYWSTTLCNVLRALNTLAYRNL